MKRRNKIALTLTILSLMGLWGLFFINKHYFIIWNANKVTVIAQPPLDSKKVKIEFGISVNTINRANDLDLFKNRSKYIVIYNGQNLTEIDNEYGENDFLITYDDLYYLAFRHFKLHNRSQHDYLFKFSKKNGVVAVEVIIKGRDQMTFKMNMIPINKSKDTRCNVPIKEAGVVYDGVTLRNN